ncbi:G patch domain-containing protein 3 [Chanos chanos]|uniref:G patch domain-containing protein 3 n=1 Tax=Chanos chanos TaxID=29144 RepID=A0A6J2W2I2_CHACN|nr:G patch domain-containing protein 3 [Chanos chanos]
MANSDEAVYFAISNIPARYRSADLRNYFSQFIESGGFICFHYRHRPEVRGETTESRETEESNEAHDKPGHSQCTNTKEGDPKTGEVNVVQASRTSEKTCCCIVSVRSKDATRFVKMYAGNQWIDSKGDWLAKRCVIRRIKVSDHREDNEFPYKTKAELRRHIAMSERFTEAHLKALPELNPPALMPSGNVGTPVSVFLQLIQSCRLPPRLIRKLGLTFPKTGSNRRYGNVPYQYKNSTVVASAEESVFTAGGHEISGPGSVVPPKEGPKQPVDSTHEQDTPDAESEEAQSDADDDDDRCEEWERHEALHEDVTSQERTKERLFEEEIELKWEKGGSGLVFYTDAQYWQEEEGDFDEQTADDWDVDMSVYYDKDGGDKDARDYVRMRYEKRLREGLEAASGQQQQIGSFEKFTKGVGRRVMEKQGWKEGEGLGYSQAGMPEALENEGQHPRCKRGFGYHGEKLSSFMPLKKSRPDFHISTIYDKPKDIDKGDSLLRRQPSTSMKFRDWRPGGSVGPSS